MTNNKIWIWLNNVYNIYNQIIITNNKWQLVNRLNFLSKYILEWTAGKIESVTKNVKKTLNNCGRACLKICQ